MLVLPHELRGLTVHWRDVAGDTFRLYRSVSPEDGFELLVDNYSFPFYEDTEVNTTDTGTRYYYKVEGVSGGVVVAKDGPATLSYNGQDHVARKIIYEFEVVLRAMRNPEVKVLLKRRMGTRCPECWNPVTKKPRFANCESCNGTGYLEGYYKPITTKISRDFSQLIDYTSMLDGDKVNKTSVNAWILNTPLVSPGDVIVDVTNERFLIERVVQRTKSQFIIRQVLDLIPLEKGHPVYQVNVEGVM